MITTERLEELIKQGTTIWRKGFFWRKSFIDKIFPLKLDERNSCISMPDMRLWVGGDCFDINTLFETKDRAEWALKTTAEHTERFEPPMWEDIKDRYEFDFTNDCGDYKFNVIKSCMIEIIIHRKANEPTYFEWLFEVCDDECTKENYIKACEIVRDLFKNGGVKC